jgi:hypothetical protein
MKQITYAHTMFSMDSEDYLPAPTQAKHSWDDLLGEYDGRQLTSTEVDALYLPDSESDRHAIYVCPSDDTGRVNSGSQLVRSYSVNRGIGRKWNGVRGPIQTGWQVEAQGDDPYSLRLDDAPDPAKSIFMYDFGAYNKLGNNSGSCTRGYDLGRDFLESKPIVHGGVYSLNFAYPDAHVSTTSFTATMGDRDLWSAPNCVGTPWDWKQ